MKKILIFSLLMSSLVFNLNASATITPLVIINTANYDWIYSIAISEDGKRLEIRYKLNFMNEVDKYNVEYYTGMGWSKAFSVAENRGNYSFSYFGTTYYF
jgi:hypothetical protein